MASTGHLSRIRNRFSFSSSLLASPQFAPIGFVGVPSLVTHVACMLLIHRPRKSSLVRLAAADGLRPSNSSSTAREKVRRKAGRAGLFVLSTLARRKHGCFPPEPRRLVNPKLCPLNPVSMKRALTNKMPEPSQSYAQ